MTTKKLTAKNEKVNSDSLQLSPQAVADDLNARYPISTEGKVRAEAVENVTLCLLGENILLGMTAEQAKIGRAHV